jgi:putative membrane protein
MLIELIVSLLIGICLGTFTGLVPGIHINLVGAILISLSVKFAPIINPIYLVIVIVAMAITHTFVDFIPSIFLGCPDTETELSILPGHEMLKQGKGYEAIALTLYGGLAAAIILILVSFPAVLIISKAYAFLIKGIAYILIVTSLFLICLEKNKFSAFLAFSISGILGLCALNFNVKEPLLPLLTGLFGSSMIISSIKEKVKIPKQEITFPKITSARPLFGSLIASLLCGFLPGLGSGQAAILGTTLSRPGRKSNSLTKNKEKEEFLFLLGATNILVMGFSFISLYAISRTRTGAAAAVMEIIGELNTPSLVLILGIILLSGVIAFFISIFLAKRFAEKVSKIDYVLISKIVLIFLTIVVLFFSGLKGFFVLVVSTLVGIYCISLKVRRTQMMGCLLLPTILFYLMN